MTGLDAQGPCRFVQRAERGWWREILGDQRGMETTLSVRIIRTSDRLVIWEGRATQRGALNSPAAQPGIAAAKLAEALFKNFPGTNGETVTIP